MAAGYRRTHCSPCCRHCDWRRGAAVAAAAVVAQPTLVLARQMVEAHGVAHAVVAVLGVPRQAAPSGHPLVRRLAALQPRRARQRAAILQRRTPPLSSVPRVPPRHEDWVVQTCHLRRRRPGLRAVVAGVRLLGLHAVVVVAAAGLRHLPLLPGVSQLRVVAQAGVPAAASCSQRLTPQRHMQSVGLG